MSVLHSDVCKILISTQHGWNRTRNKHEPNETSEVSFLENTNETSKWLCFFPESGIEQFTLQALRLQADANGNQSLRKKMYCFFMCINIYRDIDITIVFMKKV